MHACSAGSSNTIGAFLYEHLFHDRFGPLINVSAASFDHLVGAGERRRSK